jgi:hypothetical protein
LATVCAFTAISDVISGGTIGCVLGIHVSILDVHVVARLFLILLGLLPEWLAGAGLVVVGSGWA